MHEDHRKRVRSRFLAEGLDRFEPHNILEFLLFYSIPRQDTNETAHLLLDKFGSLRAVFEADLDDLTSTPGVGENSAVLLKLIPQLARRYFLDCNSGEKFCPGRTDAARYLIPFFAGRTVETVYLLLLSGSFEVLGCELIFEGSVNSAHLTSRALIERAISKHASMVVLAHNHPGGVAVASSDDISTTHAMIQAFSLVDVVMIDHFVISGEQFRSVLKPDGMCLSQELLESPELQYFYTH